MVNTSDILIIGAGPSGLAAAIAAGRHGLKATVLEQGTLVNSIQRFPRDMTFFTTPELLEIGEIPFVSPHEKPSRSEALRYYRRVTDRFRLDVRFHTRVVAASRDDRGQFHVQAASAGDVAASHWQAPYVVMATGAYDLPNPLGIEGEDLPHVSHFYDEAHNGFRQDVVVVGGRNSAVEAALELYRAGGRVTLVHRGATLGDGIKYWVRPDIENRIREGSVRAFFNTRVTAITPTQVMVETDGDSRTLDAQRVYLLTGYRADTTLLESMGVEIQSRTLAPVCDPDTFETSIPNLFLAGSVMAGRESGRIFIENGRLHGASVVEHIAARMARGPQ